MTLTSANCRAENVVVLPVVVSEVEFCDVERQIFRTDLVIGADHAALQQRPEAFDGVGVAKKKSDQSVNEWSMRCLEKCAAPIAAVAE